jgi:hypothetical protein
MNTKSKVLFATIFAISLAAPAFADEPESLVNDPRNRVTSQPREQVLIMQATPMQATPTQSYRNQAPVQHRNQAPAPRYYYNSDDEGQYDHAKGNIH